MKINAAASDLSQGYEALRAQAVGEIPTVTPRGLAVFMGGGLPNWMRACAPTDRSSSPTAAPIACSRQVSGLTSLSVELVRLLTEMALSSERRCYA
jgi:hypothetical protein